jgi:hypothetical protein
MMYIHCKFRDGTISNASRLLELAAQKGLAELLSPIHRLRVQHCHDATALLSRKNFLSSPLTLSHLLINQRKMPGFEPKTPVVLDPPKDDVISLEYLAKCNGTIHVHTRQERWINPRVTGKTEGYPTYVAIKVVIK